LVAQRDEPEFALMVDCLVPGNQAWAEQAPVLLLALAEPNFSHNGKPNRHAWHDVGLALGNLLAQATAMGIAAHLMAGFSPEAAQGAFQIPDTHSPVTLLALGYPGDPESLPDELRERELAPRSRKPLENFVFQQRFGTPRSF
ncbi:MAG: nitroreductase family protein, partial [Pelagibacteraceae bacterium]